MIKLKSFDETTKQLRDMQISELQIKTLESEVYVDITWEDWAFLVTHFGHTPEVIAMCYDCICVKRDKLVSRLFTDFYCFSIVDENKKIFLSYMEDHWYGIHLRTLG